MSVTKKLIKSFITDVPGNPTSRNSDQKISSPRPISTDRPRSLLREPPAISSEEEPTISPRPISTRRRRPPLSEQSEISQEDESDDYDGPVHLERVSTSAILS